MKTIHAIYEDGIFRPQEAVSLPAGARVSVSIPEYIDDGDELPTLSEEDAQLMMDAIEEEFERIDPDDWK